MKLTIIIDKNMFIGEKLPRLCILAKRHKVVLIPELLYECATSEESKERMLLSRATDLIRAGAYVGLEERDIVLIRINPLIYVHNQARPGIDPTFLQQLDYQRTSMADSSGVEPQE